MPVDTEQATSVTVFSHKSTDYYTPEGYIEAARTVLGGIDLDPASDEFPQTWIRARRYYTPKDDGLTKPWSGRVWMNPPYSKGPKNRSNQDIWTERLIDSYQYGGDVTAAIFLVKAALGYKWFERLFGQWPVCLTRKRIRFLTKDGPMPPAKQANAFFFLPPSVKRQESLVLFKRTFEPFGLVLIPDRFWVNLDKIFEAWRFSADPDAKSEHAVLDFIKYFKAGSLSYYGRE